MDLRGDLARSHAKVTAQSTGRRSGLPHADMDRPLNTRLSKDSDHPANPFTLIGIGKNCRQTAILVRGSCS